MNRTDRLFAIREELRGAGKGGRTADRLAEVFEVSVRTIKRDVTALAQSGFPVWARPGPGGGYVVDRSATLPPVNFTESEVAGLAAAAAASWGQPFDQDLRAVLRKVLSAMDGPARRRTARLTDRVWMNVSHNRRNTRNLRCVEQSLVEQRVLALRYSDRHGTITLRRVDPVLLAHTRGTWYLIAHCRTAGAIRWFRLDRIEVANLTTERASNIPVESVGIPPPTARPLSDL
ncbi:helix-turn-helix transcriptional regulator [Rhodococcus sp. P1Y]|uniref:helix-turn-helix transcriptional regulator n=1 Tax=Rhodococcus sp. P1Y TaxID=1302308 RepID=UPI000EB496E9|nr:WYL domain-containing protein [Rhodococcus sp. P1Y]AYJ50934.1 WYL domain-containing protein [Rhodococcus sp. P1Y]